MAFGKVIVKPVPPLEETVILDDPAVKECVMVVVYLLTFPLKINLSVIVLPEGRDTDTIQDGGYDVPANVQLTAVAATDTGLRDTGLSATPVDSV